MQRRELIKHLGSSTLLLNPFLKFLSSVSDDDFNHQLFGDDFSWGVSAAATQIEGAVSYYQSDIALMEQLGIDKYLEKMFYIFC
jgi:hypothetical protein